MISLGWAGLSRAILAAIGASLLAGCARSPSTLPPPVRQLNLEIRLAEPANLNYHYFFAIDADGDDSDGPVPVVGAGPFGGGEWFTYWGMISDTDPPEIPSDWVEYHNGYFWQVHDGDFIGIPYRRSVSPDGTRLSVTVDLDQVTRVVTRLDINFITVDSLVAPPPTPVRENYDALGDMGNDYISVPIDYSYQSGVDNSTACPGGASCEDDQEVKPLDPSLDIIDWSVTVNLPD